MNLSLPQQFEAEAIKRSIDDTDDLDQLKALARELADLYVRQRAATAWVIAEKEASLLAVASPATFQALACFVDGLPTQKSRFVAVGARDRPKLEGRSQRHHQPREHNPARIRHRCPAMRSMMANGKRLLPASPPIKTTVDPEVRQFVISQLVVIALPVGTLFGIWLWMLNWRGHSRKDQ